MCFLKDVRTQNVPTNISFKTYYAVTFDKRPKKWGFGHHARQFSRLGALKTMRI